MKARIERKTFALNASTVLWLFVIGSIAGLVIETIFHAFAFGGYESRAGLVWGPFSPIYGVGAVALTLLGNKLMNKPAIVVFLVAAVVGSAVEFATSWGMETFFGAVAWDYSGTIGSIQGRVNLMFGLMWGTLGLIWTRFAIPLLAVGFSRVDWKRSAIRFVSVGCSVFMTANIVMTVQALDRENARTRNVPASTPMEQFLDEQFPSSWMQARFENMTVHGTDTL